MDPSDMARMGVVWSYFMSSGRANLVCGPQSKVIVIPWSPDGDDVTRIQRFRKHQCLFANKQQIVQHKDMVNI